MIACNPGWRGLMSHRASTSTPNRFTGTRRPTATTNGTGDFSPPGENRSSMPGGTTWMRLGLKCSFCTSSRFDDSDSVTICVRR